MYIQISRRNTFAKRGLLGGLSAEAARYVTLLPLPDRLCMPFPRSRISNPPIKRSALYLVVLLFGICSKCSPMCRIDGDLCGQNTGIRAFGNCIFRLGQKISEFFGRDGTRILHNSTPVKVSWWLRLSLIWGFYKILSSVRVGWLISVWLMPAVWQPAR
jgi:hypothetical protein